MKKSCNILTYCHFCIMRLIQYIKNIYPLQGHPGSKAKSQGCHVLQNDGAQPHSWDAIVVVIRDETLQNGGLPHLSWCRTIYWKHIIRTIENMHQPRTPVILGSSEYIWMILNAWESESQHESAICKQNRDNTPGLYKMTNQGWLNNQHKNQANPPKNIYKITNLHSDHIVDPQWFTLGILYKMTRASISQNLGKCTFTTVHFYFLQ